MPGHGRRVTAVKEGDRATSTGAPKVDRAGERASASNRAMGRLLRVGSEHADAEHLAERLAGAAFRRTRDDTAPAPQLGVGPRPEGKRTGSDVSPVVAEGIGRLRGGGQRLDAAARGPLEQAYGRGLGHVREHRGPNVDPIAAALGARAFTLGHDVFVRSDQPRAETAAGLSLYAHEVAHTFEGAGDTIRRTKFDSTLARYYSSTLEGQRITDTQGVITATANEAIGGGHTTMYLESLKAGTIDDWRVDLRVGGAGSFASSVDPSGKGSSVAKSTGEGLGGTTGSGALSSGSQEKISGSTGSGSGMVGKMEIRIFKASASNLKDLKAATKKRSFVTTRTGIEAALAKATDIKDHLSDYAYRLMGRSFIGRKKSLNCARFGQKMLKAAGVDAADASAGSWLKLPSTLAKGADVGHVVDPDWEASRAARAAAAAAQAAAEAAAAQAAALAQAGVDAALAAVAPGAADPRVATVPCPMVWKGGLTPGLTIRGYDANDPTTLQTFRTAAPVAALGDIRAGGWLNFLPSDKDLGFIRYLGDGFRADGTPVRTVYFPIDEVLTAANQPR